MLESRMFPKQLEFVTDHSRYKSLLCARRSAKTFSAALVAVITAWKYPKCLVRIIGTKDTAVRDVWTRDVLDVIFEWLPFLPVKKCLSPMEYRLGNGSRIQLVGGGVGENTSRRGKGVKCKLIIIDEAQDFEISVKELVDRTCGPMLLDQRGSLIVCGTPGMARTYFHAISHGEHADAADGIDWKTFHWTALDNPHMEEQVREEIAAKLKVDPDYLSRPTYLREYCGLWVLDGDQRIFSISENQNFINELPDWTELAAWKRITVLSLDFGHRDSSAFVVVTYTHHDRHLYVLHTEATPGLATSQIMDRAKELYKEFNCDFVIADDSKWNTVEYNSRYGMNIRPLQKPPSVTPSQLMMNSDLTDGVIKLLPEPFDDMKREWDNLVWDQRLREKSGGELREKAGLENHRSDALRYAWNVCRNHNAAAEEPKKTSAQIAEEQMWDEAGEQSRVLNKLSSWRSTMTG